MKLKLVSNSSNTKLVEAIKIIRGTCEDSVEIVGEYTICPGTLKELLQYNMDLSDDEFTELKPKLSELLSTINYQEENQ